MPTSDKPASPGISRRLASLCYELLLLFALLLLTLILPHLLIGVFAHHLATPTLLWSHLFIVLLLYFTGFWCSGGQTLPMKTWRIRLVNSNGLPVRPAQALTRYLLCWPSFGLAGVGLLWALFDRDGQFLHDRIAGTQLIMA